MPRLTTPPGGEVFLIRGGLHIWDVLADYMCLLEVDTVGLRMLTPHCQAWAAEVRTGSTTASGGMSCQATAAAVSVVDAGVNTAAEILAGQLQSTAARLTAASGSYSINDEESAGELHDLITEL